MSIDNPLGGIWPPRLVKPYEETIKRETNWLDPGVTRRLREAIGPTVRKTYYFWKKRARKADIPLPRLLRNLVAVSTADELDRIRITLRWLSHFPEDPSDSIAKKLLNEIPKRASAIGVVEKLVFAKEKLTLREIHDAGLAAPREIPKLLNAPPSHIQIDLPGSFVGFARAFPEWVEQKQSLITVFERGNYKKLHPGQFDRLSPDVKKMITKDPKLRKNFLLKEVVERLQKEARNKILVTMLDYLLENGG